MHTSWIEAIESGCFFFQSQIASTRPHLTRLSFCFASFHHCARSCKLCQWKRWDTCAVLQSCSWPFYSKCFLTADAAYDLWHLWLMFLRFKATWFVGIPANWTIQAWHKPTELYNFRSFPSQVHTRINTVGGEKCVTLVLGCWEVFMWRDSSSTGVLRSGEVLHMFSQRICSLLSSASKENNISLARGAQCKWPQRLQLLSLGCRLSNVFVTLRMAPIVFPYIIDVQRSCSFALSMGM